MGLFWLKNLRSIIDHVISAESRPHGDVRSRFSAAVEDHYSVRITQHYVVSRYLPAGVVGQVRRVQVGVSLPVRTHGLDHLPSDFITRFLQTQTRPLKVGRLHDPVAADTKVGQNRSI